MRFLGADLEVLVQFILIQSRRSEMWMRFGDIGQSIQSVLSSDHDRA